MKQFQPGSLYEMFRRTSRAHEAEKTFRSINASGFHLIIAIHKNLQSFIFFVFCNYSLPLYSFIYISFTHSYSINSVFYIYYRQSDLDGSKFWS